MAETWDVGVATQDDVRALYAMIDYVRGLIIPTEIPLAGTPRAIAAEDTPVNAVASALTTALAGTHNDLVYTAKTKGVSGNSLTIAYVDPGVDGVIDVAVTDTAIVVTLAYGTGAITSTADAVKIALAADEAADALVSVADAGGNDGSGLVTALAATALAGGIDGTPGGAGEWRYDDTYYYFSPSDQNESGADWRRILLPAAY